MVNTAASSPFPVFAPLLYNYSFLPFFSIMWIWLKNKQQKKPHKNKTRKNFTSGRKLLSEFQEEKNGWQPRMLP